MFDDFNKLFDSKVVTWKKGINQFTDFTLDERPATVHVNTPNEEEINYEPKAITGTAEELAAWELFKVISEIFKRIIQFICCNNSFFF